MSKSNYFLYVFYSCSSLKRLWNMISNSFSLMCSLKLSNMQLLTSQPFFDFLSMIISNFFNVENVQDRWDLTQWFSKEQRAIYILYFFTMINSNCGHCEEITFKLPQCPKFVLKFIFIFKIFILLLIFN